MTEQPTAGRILVSAYACEPDRGSEPEVGLQIVLAAATRYDVWVITRSNNVEAVEAYFAGHPLGPRVRVVGVDLGTISMAIKRRLGPLGFYWYYDRWQRRAGDVARSLHSEVGFDLAHHATLATYWQPTIGGSIEVPFLWGPVGGGVQTPLPLLPELGWRGMLRDAVRFLTQRISERRPAVRRTMEAATLTLAQNPETAARVRGAGRIEILPNGVAASVTEQVASGERSHEVVMIGRQIPYKAGVLGVRTLAASRHPELRLTFIGGGPERRRIERVASELGVADRVEFSGHIPRSDVIARVGRAAALLHPALHDDSPLTVCEALSLGTPVVALDVGGPPVLIARWPDVPSVAVRPGGRSATVRRLAAALDELVESPPPIPDGVLPPVQSFADGILDAYRSVTA